MTSAAFPLLWRELRLNTTKMLLATYIVGPTVYLALFSVAFEASIGTIAYKGLNVGYINYLVPGIMAIQVFQIFTRALSVVRLDNVTGFFITIMTTRAKTRDYIMSKLLTFFLITTVQVLYIITIGWVLTRYVPTLSGVLLMLMSIYAGISLWFSLGFISGIFVKSEITRDILMTVVTLPLMFASTAYYPLNNAPAWLAIVSQLNPLSHISNTVRDAYFGMAPSFIEICLLITLSGVLVMLLSRLIKRMATK